MQTKKKQIQHESYAGGIRGIYVGSVFLKVHREGFQVVECDIHETAKDKKGKRRFVIMRDQTKDEKRYDQAIVSKFKKSKNARSSSRHFSY